MAPTLCEFEFLLLWVKLTETRRLGTYYGFIYEDGETIQSMTKWALNRGSEDNSLVGSGTHYDTGYHKLYTLTGTTGPLEGGKMQVDMKVGYASVWPDVTMKGHFDLEENSVRGTMTMSDGTQGDFVFKRDPDFVRLYPAPSTIDASTRWKFVTTVTLDRIRRQSWSPSYILKRIKDGKRYMELALRYEYYGKELDDDESDEFHSLLSSLYEADARFYASLINIKLSKVPIQYVNSRSWVFKPVLTPVNAAPLTATSVALPPEELVSFAWIVMPITRWTSVRNLSVSVPWSHPSIGWT